ncbi:MAG: DUF695 domain-containing protein [Planctomycetota bacterium]
MSDDWDFYFCTVDHKPASIFVDLGIRKYAPLPELQIFAWLRLSMQFPRDDGSSSREEFEALIQIEHAVEAALADHAEKILYVGRNTSDGNRDFYFYTDNGVRAESVLSEAMVPFPSYEFETGARHDAAWETYLNFLLPSDREMQTIQNGRVLDALEEKGDQHDTVREVSHWVYFEAAEARERFLTEVRQRGYREISKNENTDYTRPFGAIIASDIDVNYGTINDVTLELFDLAKETGGEYDGWEARVERS